MKNINVVLGGVVVVALVFASLFFAKTPVVVVQDSGNDVKAVEMLGGIPTLDGVDNPYVSINGVKQYYYNQNMAATSSTVCSLKNPFTGTSTLRSYTARVSSNGIGVTQNLYLSTSTTNIGTSSPSIIDAFPTGTGQFSLTWFPYATTTAKTIGGNVSTQGYSDILIGPNQYINFEIASATPGTFSSYYTGTCKGVFESF